MTFQWPLALGLLALIPLGLLVYAMYRRRVARNAVPFSDVDLLVQAAGPRRRRTYIPAALALGALAAFIVGLARPQADMQVPREQATIMLAIDTSGSMAADDVAPYRLRAAQDAAIAFSKTLPRQYRLGLVSFAGTPHFSGLPYVRAVCDGNRLLSLLLYEMHGRAALVYLLDNI